MNRAWLLVLLLIAAPSGAETLSHGRFQNLPIYRPGGAVERVVLFLSGEQGWTSELSRSATLSYAMLAQAPAETFAGGISIDFGPQLMIRKRLCEAGTLHLAETQDEDTALASGKLEAPWIALQTRAASARDTPVTQRFVSEAPGSQLVVLPQDANWEAAVSAAVRRLDPPPRARPDTPEELEGLPIIEVPAKRSGPTLAILICGDGGWAGIDKAVAASLAAQNIAVVGVDSLRYFWKERTPQSTAADIDRIVRHYLEAWSRKDAVLIGYSQGADVLPFVVNRLAAQTRARVRLVAMLGLSERAVFEFHLASWLSDSDDGFAIAPELRRMSGIRALCVYSDDEDESSCPEAAGGLLRAVNLPGGHHFGGDYDRVAALILEQVR